jgi:hypothetical protein
VALDVGAEPVARAQQLLAAVDQRAPDHAGAGGEPGLDPALRAGAQDQRLDPVDDRGTDAVAAGGVLLGRVHHRGSSRPRAADGRGWFRTSGLSRVTRDREGRV